jgi:hypothetical protein
VGRRGVRLCRAEGCLSVAAFQKRYCNECRERLDVTSSRDARTAALRLKSPEMREAVQSIRVQVLLMAESDPFYRGRQ